MSQKYVYSVNICHYEYIRECDIETENSYITFIVLEDDYYLKELVYLYSDPYKYKAESDIDREDITSYDKIGIYNPPSDDKFIDATELNNKYIKMMQNYKTIFINLSIKYLKELDVEHHDTINLKYFSEYEGIHIDRLLKIYKTHKVYRSENYIFTMYNNELVYIDDNHMICYILKFKPDKVSRLFRDVYIDICISFDY